MNETLPAEEFGYRFVETKDLIQDPHNPRLPAKYRDGNEQNVIEWMLRESSILELMGAISQVGFFPGEPLLVVPADTEGLSGKYYVIEGNRRLTAVQLLLNPEKATIYKELIHELSQQVQDKSALSQLPVIVYKERGKILDYLGYRHVTGIKEWGPPEKVEYLKQLAASEPYLSLPTVEKHRALARAIGSKPDYVARLLTALELVKTAGENKYLDAEQLEYVNNNFTTLTTALYYKNIAEFINIDPRDITLDGLDSEELTYLLDWLYKKEGKSTVLGESRNLKQLNQVVANKDAVEYLKAHRDLPAAAQIATTEEPLEAYRNQIFRTLKGLGIALDILEKVVYLHDSDKDQCEELEAKSTMLSKRVVNKLTNVGNSDGKRD